MGNVDSARARAVADLAERQLLATVTVAASPERVFNALTSAEITGWWVRPGVFDTREWSGDVRVGGRWRASGVARGQRYTQEGEFLEVDSARNLVHTWDWAGNPGAPPSTVTYYLEAVDGGTRITLRQSGFPSGEVCGAFAVGWETSFERLAELLTPKPAPRGEPVGAP